MAILDNSAKTYCVALRGPTFEKRAILKQFGFRWNPTTKTWNRLVADLGAAKTLARQMRDDHGYKVSLHEVRINDIQKSRTEKFIVIEGDKPAIIKMAPGKARSYHGCTDFAAHYSGGKHGWKMTSRHQ